MSLIFIANINTIFQKHYLFVIFIKSEIRNLEFKPNASIILFHTESIEKGVNSDHERCKLH